MARNRFTHKVFNIFYLNLHENKIRFELSYGEKWQFRRRLLTPTFHFDILNDFLGVMNEQAEILTSKLTELVRTGEDIDIFKRIKLCTLDIICGATF
jgi:cytochrome P450